MLASIVIPVRDDKRIRRCIRSVLNQSQALHEKYEVIVVDNNSETVDIGQLLCDFPVTLLTETRPGLCAAVNHGLRYASGELLVRIDADCVATPNWLEKLLCSFSDPTVGAVGGAIYKEEGDSLIDFAARNLVIGDQLEPQFLPMFDAPYVVTANAAYRLNLIRELGGFDEQFFSGGDVDICWRICLAGFQVRTAPAAIIYHPIRPSIRKYFSQFYNYALGHVLLFKKYKTITGKRFLINTYPFMGILKLVLNDIPTMLLEIFRTKKFDRVRSTRILLDFIEYSALLCGYIVGAVKFRVLYL
jgi:GT2 family glycosyltransferase